MKIGLSKFEVELLDQALEAWEKEPQSDAALGSIFAALISGPANAERTKALMLEERQRGKQEQTSRRLKATLLRAKLLQSLALDSEHNFENPVTPPLGGK